MNDLEAAVRESTVRRWIADGLLPTVPVPGRKAGKEMLRVRGSDLDGWIRELPAAHRGDERHERSVGSELRRRVAAGQRSASVPTSGGLDAAIERHRARKGRGVLRGRSRAAGARPA